ncbi:hypothetical protein Glove_141g57 [Diversispora epigaea]|uniref:Uncharacterized protein n=1 Tax=Diversispora epigaea TaxID=1348612 RepID=A0A397IXI2_9GLOM|nr:hypothetical protein Glove_141g57 [Diversispora epigaea]
MAGLIDNFKWHGMNYGRKLKVILYEQALDVVSDSKELKRWSRELTLSPYHQINHRYLREF